MRGLTVRYFSSLLKLEHIRENYMAAVPYRITPKAVSEWMLGESLEAISTDTLNALSSEKQA